MLLRAVDCQREPKVGDKVNFDVEPVKLDRGRLGGFWGTRLSDESIRKFWPRRAPRFCVFFFPFFFLQMILSDSFGFLPSFPFLRSDVYCCFLFIAFVRCPGRHFRLDGSLGSLLSGSRRMALFSWRQSTCILARIDGWRPMEYILFWDDPPRPQWIWMKKKWTKTTGVYQTHMWMVAPNSGKFGKICLLILIIHLGVINFASSSSPIFSRWLSQFFPVLIHILEFAHLFYQELWFYFLFCLNIPTTIQKSIWWSNAFEALLTWLPSHQELGGRSTGQE